MVWIVWVGHGVYCAEMPLAQLIPIGIVSMERVRHRPLGRRQFQMRRTSGFSILVRHIHIADWQRLVRLSLMPVRRVSRTTTGTAQRLVVNGRLSPTMVYATAGEPMAELPAMPELALVGANPRCKSFGNISQ